MQKLVCVIGADGSGKTTLCRAAKKELNTRGFSSTVVWLGAESFLMKPMRYLLRFIWINKKKDFSESSCNGEGSKRVNYAREIHRKNNLAVKFGWATRLYLALVWCDYKLQVTIKRWNCREASIIFADRYLFDVAVNIGLTLGWPPGRVISFIQGRISKMQLPELRVFLRVDPHVSLQRKDDILDVDYLKLRFTYYEAIAKAFGFVERDGTLPIETNRDWLLNELELNQERLYVLYVHSNNIDIGGADKVLALMATQIQDYEQPKTCYRVGVCLRLQTDIVKSYEAVGIPIFAYPFIRPQVSKGISGLCKFIVSVPITLWFFMRLYKREKPNIVHVNDLYDFLPALAARLMGIPLIWHIRMIVMNERLRKLFAYLVSKTSRVSISVSKAVCTHYFTSSLNNHKALVIHDLGNSDLVKSQSTGTIVNKQRPMGIPKGGRLVVMIGRIEPWKGQDVFVEAVSLLRQDLITENQFILIGGEVDGKEAYFAKVSAKAMGVGIEILGSRNDIPEILSTADISVHCSVTPDPFPGVVIESLLSGAATIAANAGGPVEMIDDHVHGILIEPDDANNLCDALTELLDSPIAPRELFGHAARKRALSITDTADINSQLSDIYADISK